MSQFSLKLCFHLAGCPWEWWLDPVMSHCGVPCCTLPCAPASLAAAALAWLYVSCSVGRALPSQTRAFSCHIPSFMEQEPWRERTAPPRSAPHGSRQLHTWHFCCCKSWDSSVASHRFSHFIPIRKVEKCENVIFSYRVAAPSLGQPR